MILCEWDAPEGDPGQSCVHLFARILSTSFSSVSIFSVCCYSSVSISVVHVHTGDSNSQRLASLSLGRLLYIAPSSAAMVLH
jgi:hypothetical protein